MITGATQQNQHAKSIPSPIPSTDYEGSDYASSLASVSRGNTLRELELERSNLSSVAPSCEETDDAEENDSFAYDQGRLSSSFKDLDLSNTLSGDEKSPISSIKTPSLDKVQTVENAYNNHSRANSKSSLSSNHSSMTQKSVSFTQCRSPFSNRSCENLTIPKKNPARSMSNTMTNTSKELTGEDSNAASDNALSSPMSYNLESPIHHAHTPSDSSFSNSIVSSVSDIVGSANPVNSIASFGFSDDSYSFQEVHTPHVSDEETTPQEQRTGIYRSNSIDEEENPISSMKSSMRSEEPNIDEDSHLTLLPKVMALPDPRFTNVLSAFDALTRKYLLRENSKVVYASSNEGFSAPSRRVVNSCFMPARDESIYSRYSISPQNMQGRGRLYIRLEEIRNLTIPLASGVTTNFTYQIKGVKGIAPWQPLHSTTSIEKEYIFDESADSSIVWALKATYEPPKTRSRSGLGKVFSTSRRKSSAMDPVSEALHGYVLQDGTFGEISLDIDSISRSALGRCQSMMVPIINKWIVDPTARDAKPSSRKVGDMMVHVFALPTLPVSPKELPSSIEAAMEDLKLAEWDRTLLCDGYLCQQGGDCPYWRRRYFQLIGSKLVAFQPFTKTRRATIELSEATHIVDDNHYSDEEELEGYLYFEAGFRIIFKNSDYIDFYAETVDEKEEWMSTLRQYLGQCARVRKKWTKAFLSLTV
ncbi:medial ring protein Mid2 [Schizosaccharomyces cryophilus OY26]|uniref:Medial ring protein Mid2 n=1 Tax=Schizosaccharomyces cryophilus (strain OY26 / ATCC MYA-4695 / CBS 11777 / NBRC 106824 / NRRL Y48691) TaxID=653667 RepID=S9VQY0_SCHCR|nr:medial ring protein Mid2 [Schizosaccharomyces cryophilus OY26]EPY50328.1 medial ring protein Mid2 [Schizosaccharomyces cryophilus OY26]